MHLQQVTAVYEAPMVLGESVLLTELPECRYRFGGTVPTYTCINRVRHLSIVADVSSLVWRCVPQVVHSLYATPLIACCTCNPQSFRG